VLTDIEKAQGAQEMKVRVVGEQFAWTFFYPDASGKEVASPQLYLPKGRPVDFTIQSKDVLHDFWVPAFRIKKDAVPGIDTSYRVTPTRVGSYPIVCAELCGLGHAVMRSTAHVVSAQQFSSWIGNLRKRGGGAPAAGPGGGATAATDAKTIFTQTASPTCATCHTLSAAGATGTVGPNLDQGLKGKSAAFIKQSIQQPDAVVTNGFSRGIMPGNYDQTLQPAQIDALVKYLSKVTK
jgi:cytochrome c oxidase subunit 2